MKLGKLPAISSPKLLHFANYVGKAVELPKATNFWTKRAKFPIPMFGNDKYGDCTRASQAHATLRMERLEQRRNIIINDEEVVRVYFEMTKRRYPPGGDLGAYEMDALSDWRNPDATFRDTKGRPLTIDAFTRVNQANATEVKTALWLAKSHGIKMCFNLPIAFQRKKIWDIPEGQKLVNDWQPGSWGGHSTFVYDFSEFGIILPTWDITVTVSWRAVAAYSDECFSYVDSIDQWRKKLTAKQFDLKGLAADVNSVSDIKIK